MKIAMKDTLQGTRLGGYFAYRWMAAVIIEYPSMSTDTNAM